MFAIIKRVISNIRNKINVLLGRTTSVVGDSVFENGLIQSVKEGRYNKVSFSEFIGEKKSKEIENPINKIFVPLIKEGLKDSSNYATYNLDE